MREAFIEELPLKFRGAARKLKRDTSLWRLPLDWLALNDARLAIEAAEKELPEKVAGNTPEFLPDTEGRIEAGNNKWRKLPEPERKAIEDSRDAASNKNLFPVTGENRQTYRVLHAALWRLSVFSALKCWI